MMKNSVPPPGPGAAAVAFSTATPFLSQHGSRFREFVGDMRPPFIPLRKHNTQHLGFAELSVTILV